VYRFSCLSRLVEGGIMILTLSCAALKAVASTDWNNEWHQWRGPNRDGVSLERGILKNWPEGGPKTLWRVSIGEGFSGITISQGRIYTMYAKGNDEFVVCRSATDGTAIWQFRSDDIFYDTQGGNGPRSTPTVDGDLVFALGAKGKLYAISSKDGKKIWEHDLKDEFKGYIPSQGISTSTIIEEDLLLVDVGGEPGYSIVAFNKKSGEVIWNSQTDRPGYSSPIAVTVNGMRQIIFFTGTAVVSVAPKDGKLYWRYPWKTDWFANIATPIFIPNDKIFISSGYDKGSALLQINDNSGTETVKPIWLSKVMRNHFSSSILYEGYVYGFDEATFKCINVNTSEQKWAIRGFGKGSLIFADDHLIVLSERGKLILVEAIPSEYREKASAQVLQGKCWTVPTLSSGKLYIRNQKELICLDLTESK